MDDKNSQEASSAEELKKMLGTITSAGILRAELMKMYDKWADKLDQYVSSIVYNGPAFVAQETARLFEDKQNVRVLDVACGVGYVGQELVQHGFIHIDALDSNTTMIEKVKKINTYENFYLEFLGQNKLGLNENTYDAVVTTGSFIPSHLNDDCFEEIIRILKPGGYFVLVMADKYFHTDPEWTKNIEPHMQELEEKKQWKKITRRKQNDYSDQEGLEDCIVYVLQKSPSV